MDNFLTYADLINQEIKNWAELDSRILLIGQSVFGSSGIAKTLIGISDDRKIELPIFEDTQMGMSIGMALSGFVPITYFSRMNFFLLAMNQLVNHLDKLPLMGSEPFTPKVIVRVAVGSKFPLDAGPQHTTDCVDGLVKLVPNMHVEILKNKETIKQSYENSRQTNKSVLMIEYADLYNY